MQDAPTEEKGGDEKGEEGGEEKSGEVKAAAPQVGPDAALAGRKTVPLEAQKVTKEGWLRIGSEAFEDRSRFPNVPIVANGQTGKFDAMMHALQEGGQKFKDSIGNLQFGKDPAVKFVDMFYVRLQNTTVWFTETQDTIMIEASIHPTKATCSGEINSPGCFEIQDGNDKWVMCAEKQADADAWCCKVQEALGGDKCPDTTEGVPVVQVEEVVQPLIIIPLPSPNCATDWNFNEHGKDWQCRCPTGLEQSPIDLNNPYTYDFVKYNAEFKYNTMAKADVLVEYDLNMIRFKLDKPEEQSFGTLKDIDQTEYKAYEVRVKTPSDHTILGEQFDMEVQVMHEATKGVMKNQAVLSFLFTVIPGGMNKAIGNWNVINMPNPEVTKVQQFFNEDFNVLSFIYDEIPAEDFEPQFNYYKYMGSETNPPCAENFVYFIYEKPLTLGSTAMDMIKEALFIPGQTAVDKGPNYDGNNRAIQKINDRAVFFYDCSKDCQNPCKKDSDDDKGHWEKVEKKVDRYYYIGGPNPSQLPNSYVVSKEEAELGTQNQTRGSDRYRLEIMN